ncbi:serine hydrolase [Streptomyces sp. NPDC056296]|uniref:serine hydrolase n=1 Tax=Streptomyces sp. NPDC056296 TaxID=3345775 RepID=UPI0035DD5CEA
MPRRPRITDLAALEVPETPSVSPDGADVVYVLRSHDRDADRTVRALWRVGADGSGARRLTRGPDDRCPQWSPDGRRVAFLRSQDGPPQLWVLRADGGEPEQLTELPLGAGAPVWSPDGSRIAFTAPVDDAAHPDETAEQARARRAAAPLVTDRLDYQADGPGLLGTIRGHLHVHDLGTASTRRLTHGSWHAGAPAWSPDGSRLAFPAGAGADADLTFHSTAYVLDPAETDPRPRQVGESGRFVSTTRWTPDGQALLVVERPDSPVGHARLLRLSLDGRTAEPAAELDRNVMAGAPGYPGAPPQPAADGRTVLFCVRDQGSTHVYATSPEGGAPRRVLGGEGRTVSGMSVASDSPVLAAIVGTPTSYGEVVTLDMGTGAETVCTRHGDAPAGVTPFAPVSRTFTVSDGTEVHGWLISDPDTTGPGPLLLDIHGGPHNAWSGAADEAHLYQQELAAQGWRVLLLNPRGSDGYGEAFFTALTGGWGERDRADFLEPLDQLVAEGVADPRRLAICGYSYGGYMTGYLTSRDTRFAAAVAGGMVADPASMAGASDVGHAVAVHELGGHAWDERDRYTAMSPYARVDQVRTPTLILHGQDDLRCPVDQAKQWHSALRSRGVTSRLVLYPGASHLFTLQGRPSHRLDYNRRIADWVHRYAGHPGEGTPAPVDAAHWQRRLEQLAARHGVPGASLGILRLHEGGDDELVEAAYGTTNRNTGVPVTADTLFQIGSITKVWTATLAMQLVDEGVLDLDVPVREVLPELRLGDERVTETVTMRHLLAHTSGIDGDVFTSTGRGDDCLRDYVALLDDVGQNHPLGATWSYSNAGFVLAGRVVEQLTGRTWDEALRERIALPLGLTHTVTLPEQALLHRTAVGHSAPPGEEPAPVPVWQIPRSMGPAGLVTASAADVLGFARLHLTGGLAPDGTRVLSEASATAMRDNQADLPEPYTLGDSWGLGWIRFGWHGHRVVGHDGNTIGQSAFLRMLPEAGLAVVLLTNGGHTRDLHHDLCAEIFAELASLDVPPPLSPPSAPPTVDITPHTGVYERAGMRIEVSDPGGRPTVTMTATGPLAALAPEATKERPLVPADAGGNLFCFRDPGVDTWTPVVFYALPSGERYVHVGARATRKVE